MGLKSSCRLSTQSKIRFGDQRSDLEPWTRCQPWSGFNLPPSSPTLKMTTLSKISPQRVSNKSSRKSFNFWPQLVQNIMSSVVSSSYYLSLQLFSMHLLYPTWFFWLMNTKDTLVCQNLVGVSTTRLSCFYFSFISHRSSSLNLF